MYRLFWGAFLALVLISITPAFGVGADDSEIPFKEIGTLAVGEPFRGFLINGVPFPPGNGYTLRSRNRCYTSPELIEGLLYAIDKVKWRYPDTVDLVLGDFSKPKGGRFHSHRSHQNGQDVDIGYFQKDNKPLEHLVHMNSKNLDVEKTWFLIEALLEDDKIEYIFIDYYLQKIFYKHAKDDLGYSDEELRRIFQYPRGRRAGVGIIRVSSGGHDSHMHVRFFCPKAVAEARKYTWSELRRMRAVQPFGGKVVIAKGIKPVGRKGFHVVSKGENLSRIAHRYGISIKELKNWNDIKGDCIRPGQELRIQKGDLPTFLARTEVTGEEVRATFVKTAHVVAHGDTLWDIAQTYGVNVEQVRNWNDLVKKEIIRPGQRLTVLVEQPLPPQEKETPRIKAATHRTSLEEDGLVLEGIELDVPLSEFKNFIVPVQKASP